MREILFRGKRMEVGLFASTSEKEWVYGGYAKDRSGEYIHDPMRGGHRMVKIAPETLGQFTGLTDRDGRKIFEGDICDFCVFDCFGSDTQYRATVSYEDGGFILRQASKEGNEENFGSLDLSWVRYQDDEFRVIGNIYDNPEMLGVKK